VPLAWLLALLALLVMLALMPHVGSVQCWMNGRESRPIIQWLTIIRS
jgi:hypothetical protein